MDSLSSVSESEVPNTKIAIKIWSKKRKERAELGVGEYKRFKRKAARDENFYDSHGTETASGSYSDSVCKIFSELKKEISSLKRRLKKAEEVIEKIRINKKVIFESNRLYAANVGGL